MIEKDISSEEWREYDFTNRVYRIKNPVGLFVGTSTHRVVDSEGVVHCVPNIGFQGCVLRWQTKSKLPAVQF